MTYTFDYQGRPVYLGRRSTNVAFGPQRDDGKRQTIPGGQVATVEADEDAIQVDLFVELGRVRVRSDGTNPTSETGEPMWAGTGRSWNAKAIRVLAVGGDAIVTSISR